ncbi:hypothetical protein O0L34_g18499 [Tuta absoluta]|nr:hypothetical protein O0L34_g18499 [Tuta absoluta]
MIATSVVLILFAGCCHMVASQNWTYTTEAFTDQGQACFTDCVNERCYVDMDSSPIRCTSTGVAAPRYRTKTGAYCTSNCGYFGKQYEFCATTSDTRQVDYCNSGDDQVSVYGEKCTESKCELNPQGFYWCRLGNGWQYCSPPKEDRNDEAAVENLPDWSYTIDGFTSDWKVCFSNCVNGKCYVDMDNPPVACTPFAPDLPALKYRTKTGAYCVSNCGYFGHQYKICATTKHTKEIDYCNDSFKSELSVYGKNCLSECELSAKGFYWCKVENSWQHCAPPMEV